MAYPFPADKLSALPPKSIEEISRKSRSRRARRKEKGNEARLFQSYTVVNMSDLEEEDDSQQVKQPKKKTKEDTAWRRVS